MRPGQRAMIRRKLRVMPQGAAFQPSDRTRGRMKSVR
jgi:hypothetical protein